MLPDKVTTLCSIPHSSFLVRTEVQPCSVCLVLVIMSTVTMVHVYADREAGVAAKLDYLCI